MDCDLQSAGVAARDVEAIAPRSKGHQERILNTQKDTPVDTEAKPSPFKPLIMQSDQHVHGQRFCTR